MKALVLAAFAVIGCGGSTPKPSGPLTNQAEPAPAAAEAAPTPGATVVQQTATGGVIELDGELSTAMPSAQVLMRDHCGPDNFQITQQGEEAIGADSSPNGAIVVTAWRVHFACAAP